MAAPADREVAREHLRAAGHVVEWGLKYGADFLLYARDRRLPRVGKNSGHSSHAVTLVTDATWPYAGAGAPMTWGWLVTRVRLNAAAQKKVAIVHVRGAEDCNAEPVSTLCFCPWDYAAGHASGVQAEPPTAG